MVRGIRGRGRRVYKSTESCCSWRIRGQLWGTGEEVRWDGSMILSQEEF